VKKARKVEKKENIDNFSANSDVYRWLVQETASWQCQQPSIIEKKDYK